MALAFVPSLGTAIGAARPEETGVASGLVNTSYQIGSAGGLAALTAVRAAVSQGGTDVTAATAEYSAAFLGAGILAAAGALAAPVFLRRPVVAAPAVEEAPLHEVAV